MSRAGLAAFAAVLCVVAADASAHRIDEYLQATLLTVEADRIDGAMRLIPGESVASSVIADIDADGDGVLSADEERAYAQRVLADLSVTVDGRVVLPRLVADRFPSPSRMRAGIGEIRIDYAIALPPGSGDRSVVLTNAHRSGESVYLANVVAPTAPDVHILAQQRDPRQSRYRLDFRQGAAVAVADGASASDEGSSWTRSRWSSLFRLGMRHIAEGTDHLLFLLVLLLPAPLVAAGARWGAPVAPRRRLANAAAIVTAFTIGHSIALAGAAVGGLALPTRPIEVVIALSILVSAVHAWRPLFPGREAAVAGAFGLVHGLAFAVTLERLGVDRWDRVAGTLAFNLGIEAMQLLVVAAVLPALLLLAAKPGYRIVRRVGAGSAAAAAIGWIAERGFDIATPVDLVVDTLARYAPWLAVLLLAIGLAMLRGRSARALRG